MRISDSMCRICVMAGDMPLAWLEGKTGLTFAVSKRGLLLKRVSELRMESRSMVRLRVGQEGG